MDGDEGNKLEANSTPATLSPRRSVDHVEELPDDVLLLVMGLLDLQSRIRVERVCQRWRHLALRLWKSQCRLSFEGGFFIGHRHPLMLEILHSLLVRCGKSLKSLDLQLVSHMLDNRAAETIGMLCPNLEYVDVSGVSLTDVGVQHLAEKCPKLKTVIMKWCSEVGDKGVSSLLQLCKHLEHLNLAGLHNLSGECFDKAGDRLRKLDLQHCNRVTSDGLREVTTRCCLLTKLSISYCSQTTDDDMLLLCQNLQALLVLHLDGLFNYMTSEGICAVASLPLLEELALHENPAVTDAAVGAICRGCSKLRSLNISSCRLETPDTCGRLSKCLQLRDLKMSYLGQMTDACLRSLACHGHLKSIELRGCPQVGDAGVLALVEQCRDLESLDVSGCELVTNVAVTGCLTIVAERPRKLTLIVGGTGIDFEHLPLEPSKVLDINCSNRCVEHLRPDRVERMGFDPEEDHEFSEDEEHDFYEEEDFENEDYLQDALWENDVDELEYSEPEDGLEEDVVAYDCEDWLIHEAALVEEEAAYECEDWLLHEDVVGQDDIDHEVEHCVAVDDADRVDLYAPEYEDYPTVEEELLAVDAYDFS